MNLRGIYLDALTERLDEYLATSVEERVEPTFDDLLVYLYHERCLSVSKAFSRVGGVGTSVGTPDPPGGSQDALTAARASFSLLRVDVTATGSGPEDYEADVFLDDDLDAALHYGEGTVAAILGSVVSDLGLLQSQVGGVAQR